MQLWEQLLPALPLREVPEFLELPFLDQSSVKLLLEWDPSLVLKPALCNSVQLALVWQVSIGDPLIKVAD